MDKISTMQMQMQMQKFTVPTLTHIDGVREVVRGHEIQRGVVVPPIPRVHKQPVLVKFVRYRRRHSGSTFHSQTAVAAASKAPSVAVKAKFRDSKTGNGFGIRVGNRIHIRIQIRICIGVGVETLLIWGHQNRGWCT